MFFLSFFQIGGKFKSLFGEAFYRMVVIEFYPSLRSIIVRSAILIDPDPENLYHATNIWFSIYGYINLGTFPLMPINIYLIGEYEFKFFTIPIQYVIVLRKQKFLIAVL